MKNRFTISWLIPLLLIDAACDSRSRDPGGLKSSSQEVRDAAAKALRETQTTEREKWNKVLESLPIGGIKADVLKILRPLHPVPGERTDDQNSYTEFYRFDGQWVIQCDYKNYSNILFNKSLLEKIEPVWVNPPDDFTGVWTIYYPNGQPARETHYQDGAHFGEATAFYTNGTKQVVQQIGPQGIPEGEVDYFPSGKAKSHENWKEGKPVGTWIWYREDGTVEDTKVFPPP